MIESKGNQNMEHFFYDAKALSLDREKERRIDDISFPSSQCHDGQNTEATKTCDVNQVLLEHPGSPEQRKKNYFLVLPFCDETKSAVVVSTLISTLLAQ